MISTIDKLNKIILDIETKPRMFFDNPDYQALKNFFLGYLSAIEDSNQFSINMEFTVWLNDKGPKTSLFWTAYILEINSKGNQTIAYEKLIEELKNFLKDFQKSTKLGDKV